MGQYRNEHTRQWASKIASFDGFVFVTPEYNHGTSGVLKNAIDYLYAEWNNKAAGFVSYGAVGGARIPPTDARRNRASSSSSSARVTQESLTPLHPADRPNSRCQANTNRGASCHPLTADDDRVTTEPDDELMTNDQGPAPQSGNRACDLLLLRVAPTGFEPALPP